MFGGDEPELRSAQRALAARCNAGEGHEGSGRNTVEKANWQEYYASDQYIKLWFILTFLTFVLVLFVSSKIPFREADKDQFGELTAIGLTAAWSFTFAAVLFMMFSIRV